MYKKGTIALTTLLVLTTTLTLVGISIVYLSIDSASVARTYYSTNVARAFAKGCLDEAMFNLTINPNYNGSKTINRNQNSCTFTVPNNTQNNNYRDILINSTYENSTYSQVTIVNIATSPIRLVQ